MPRAQYSTEDKENALRLCEKDGFSAASRQTGISKFTLYQWNSLRDNETAIKSKHGKRYTDEEKAEMLRLCDEIGIMRTSEQIGISASTLSRFRAKGNYNADVVDIKILVEENSDLKDAPVAVSTKMQNDSDSIELIQLRLENEALKEQVAKLKECFKGVCRILVEFSRYYEE